MLEIAYNLLQHGNLWGALAEIMTNYPIEQVGLIWIIIGFAAYAVWYGKTGDFAIPSIVVGMYLALVSSMMAPGVWIAFVLLMALSFGTLLYRLIRD